MLDHPLSRMMTAKGAEHSFAISPHVLRKFCLKSSPSEDQRAQGMPGADAPAAARVV
jgi:hypothetical protein